LELHTLPNIWLSEVAVAAAMLELVALAPGVVVQVVTAHLL
jgi:hypothetical protein